MFPYLRPNSPCFTPCPLISFSVVEPIAPNIKFILNLSASLYFPNLPG